MSKEFKRCPRCNTKTHINLKRCGTCGLNYDKFYSATNAEARSALRMGEKSRVLYSKTIPSDLSKVEMFVQSFLGGWFGLHYFKIGRLWRGMVQVLGFIFAFVYSYGAVVYGINSGYLGYIIFLCGLVWVFTFITWISDTFAILFYKFKYPVSLPYSTPEAKHTRVNITAQNRANHSIETNTLSADESKANNQDSTQSNNQENVNSGTNNPNEEKGE